MNVKFNSKTFKLDSEGGVLEKDYYVWDHLLPYMRQRGFPPALLRTSPTLHNLPPEVMLGTRPEGLEYADVPEAVLPISSVFVWEVEPDADNIEALVDYLEYKVPLPGYDLAMDSTAVDPQTGITKLPGSVSSSQIVPLQVLFDHHQKQIVRLATLIREAPQSFLDILSALSDDYDAQGIQLVDCLDCLRGIATEFTSAGNKPAEGPIPETASEIDRIWRELVEGGLSRVLLKLVGCVCVLSAMTCFSRIMRALVVWCMRKPMEVSQERSAMEREIMNLLEVFWGAIWTNRNILAGRAKPMYLVYYTEVVTEELARVIMSLLAQEYILLSRKSDTESPSRDAYLTFCRVITFVWMAPAMEKSDPQPETRSTLFALVSLFSSHRHSVLNLDDLKKFIEQEVFAQYGAKLFLANLSLALRGPSLASGDRTIAEDLCELLNIISALAIHTECKPYYASSGLLQAIRDIFDDPDVRALSPDAQWLVHLDAIVVLDRIVASVPTGRAAKALLHGHNIFALIAQSMNTYVTAPGSRAEDGSLVHIIDAYITVAGGARARGGRDDLLTAMTRALQAHWYPAYRDLYAMVQYDAQGAPFGKAVRPLEHWIELGKTLGLEVGHEKETYERKVAQMCAWRECQFHETKPSTPTRVCAGCGEVRYCSKGCQKRDWREGGHGARCKRLKEEAHARSRRGNEQ